MSVRPVERGPLRKVTEAVSTLPEPERAAIRGALREVAAAHLEAACDSTDVVSLRYRYGSWAVAEIADAVHG